MGLRSLGTGIWEITVENPAAFNALSSVIIAQTVELFRQVCGDLENRVIIFRGAEVPGKKKAPLAGADLTGLVNTDQWIPIPTVEARRHMDEGILAIKTMRQLCARDGVMCDGSEAGRVVVIGLVDGPCLAGGVEFMFGLSNIVLATPGSVFGMREAGLGGMGGWCGPQTLRERLGSPVLVIEMLLGLGDQRGGDISAETALQRGLINRIVTPELIEETALELAARVVKLDRMAVTYNLAAADYPAGQDCTPAVTGWMTELMQRKAWVDSVRGFLEKTKK